MPALLSAAALAGAPAGAAAAVTVSGPSPFAGCTADRPDEQPGFPQTNSELEPWADVNPTNPSNIVAVWQQDRWRLGGAARGLVAGVSMDGGLTWTEVPLPFSKCAGGLYDRASDPWVSFGPDGTLYAASLDFNVFGPEDAITVATSHDGGLTWSAPQDVRTDTNLAVLNDKESVTADPTRPGYAYVVWDRYHRFGPVRGGDEDAAPLGDKHTRTAQPAFLARTTDGGASWEPARKILSVPEGTGTIGNQIVVLPDGTLVDGMTYWPGHNFHVAVMRSTDAGLTWSKPILVAHEDLHAGVFDPDTGFPVRSGAVLPSFAVDRRTGWLYAAWSDSRFSGDQIFQTAFTMSTDGGRTWAKPLLQVNRTPTDIPLVDQQAFTPSVQVAADGTVGIAYYDFRSNTPGGGASTDEWVETCPSDCMSAASWTDHHVAGPFDLENAAISGGYFLGDYQALVPRPAGGFAAVFAQAVSPLDPSDVEYAEVPAS